MTLWKDSLLIGVEDIDRQHKKLVEAIDDLSDACSKGQGRAIIEKTLMFVVNYTKQHFTDEEKIAAAYNYPLLSNHKRLHVEFVTTVLGLVVDFNKNGPNIALMSRINKTLVDWLINHITVEDKKIGDFINSTKK